MKTRTATPGTTSGRQAEPERLFEQAETALTDLNVLFETPAGTGSMEVNDIEHRSFIQLVRAALTAVMDDLSPARLPQLGHRGRRVEPGGRPDSIDRLNQLAEFCRRQPFASALEAALMDLIAVQPDFFDIAVRPEHADYDRVIYQLEHAARLGRIMTSCFSDYLQLVKKLGGKPGADTRIGPDALRLGGVNRLLPDYRAGALSEKEVWQLHELAQSADPFRSGSVFRYVGESFLPATLTGVRPVDKFYGYGSVKSLFAQHFTAFLHGDGNTPILINSLPGMGKTSLTIAHTLAYPELTLVLPEPEALGSGLPLLLRRLEQRRNRKFVVFFDDLEPAKIDWYYFRTHLGGSLGAPDNVMLALASNYTYPPNVCSRGREVDFPVFDVVTCSGMIEDYLHGLKMHAPNADLIAVIAADYQEAFGQKIYAELSPRSLVRYLESFDHDLRRRKRLLEMSKGIVITKPDPQMFYDFNVKLIRQFYGEAGLEELRERILGNLS